MNPNRHRHLSHAQQAARTMAAHNLHYARHYARDAAKHPLDSLAYTNACHISDFYFHQYRMRAPYAR